MENHRGNIVFFYCNSCLHLEFARIDACNRILLVYTEIAMDGVNVSLITQINYACTTQDKLYHSTIATKLRSVASKPLRANKNSCYKEFWIQTTKIFHYQRKTNNRTIKNITA